ncbi:MAG: type II toxin-antitoxin system PemK/MazF family toxin [Candidatus Thiodiazotropha sp.]|jgi:mRNA interferase MazF
MPSTTAYKYGEVVLVGFPFTNLQTTKKRPAVVISDTAYQQGRPDVILMAITSQMRQPLTFGEYLLRDWQQARLLKPSVLKPLIATIEQKRIIKTMGQLSPADRQGLQRTLQTILGH